MKKDRSVKYAVCVKNDEYSVSLERRKLYRVLPREPFDPASMVRIVDESGEDYLFPKSWFVPVPLPIKVRKAIATT